MKSDVGREPVDLGEVRYVGATQKAIRVAYSRGRELWIPKSAVHDDSEVYGTDVEGKEQKQGETGKLVVLRWWAESHGLSAPIAAKPRVANGPAGRRS